jgi:hypothetical protein
MTEPVLVSVTDFQRIVRGSAANADVNDLNLLLVATDEVVADVVGSLAGPIPARWRIAARIIAAHLWDFWEGAVPEDYQAGTDNEPGALSGFAIPRAAMDLLKPERLARVQPRFDFPPARGRWPE